MRHRIYFVVAFLLLLSLLTAPVKAGGFPFPLPIPIPKPGGGNNSNSIVPNIQQALAAAQTEVQNAIAREVGKQLGVNAPITLDQTTAYPKLDNLPGFNPQPWTPQTAADLDKPLLPGDYAIPVGAFCTDYSIHVPGRGTPYKLAPLQGPKAAVLSRLLVNGTLQGIPHDILQYMSMRMQASVPLSQWPADYQAIVDRIDPQDEEALQGDLLAQVQKIYDDHNSIPFAKLPPLNQMLGNMGAPGQYVLELQRARKILTDKTHAAEMEPSLLYEPQGDGLPLVLSPVKKDPTAPWSLIRPGIYARFTAQDGWQGKNLLEFRILPEAITAASPNALTPHVTNASFLVGAVTFDGLPMGTSLNFQTIKSLIGLTAPVEARLVATAGGVVVKRVVIAAGAVISAPEIEGLLIGYSVYRACQALIMMIGAPGDSGNNLNKITSDPDDIQHVEDRHTPGGKDSAGKSIFDAGESIEKLIESAESVPGATQQNGNIQRIVNAGRTIGFDRSTGQPTSIYTVITTATNRLVTMFPGLPTTINLP